MGRGFQSAIVVARASPQLWFGARVSGGNAIDVLITDAPFEPASRALDEAAVEVILTGRLIGRRACCSPTGLFNPLLRSQGAPHVTPSSER